MPRSVRLSEAPSHGLPIALYRPESKGAEAYRSLALEVRGRGGSGTSGSRLHAPAAVAGGAAIAAPEARPMTQLVGIVA